MSPKVFSQALTIAKENRIPTLNFFGGEPLLNPEIFPMLRRAFEDGFSLILATNCRPFVRKKFLAEFLEATKEHKERIAIFAANDRFHLKFFDPNGVAERLKNEGYNITLQNYSDYSVAITEHNACNKELLKLNTRGSCCDFSWTDHLGVLPDGGWTICPPSLEAFGSIFANSLEKLVEFKRGLPLRYKHGCTECLKDFKTFRKGFAALMRGTGYST